MSGVHPEFLENRSSLISSIYDMALGETSWESILDMLGAAFPDCVILVSGDDVSEQRNLSFSQRGLPAAATVAYLSSFAALNPWRRRQVDQPVNQVFHDDQLVPRKDTLETDFYRKWLGTYGKYDAGTGVVILRQGARQLVIEVRYPSEMQARIRGSIARTLGEIASHFERAFKIIKSSRYFSSRGYLDTVVEELPYSVFLVTEDMQISYANATAQNLRRDNLGIFSASDGYLRIGTDKGEKDLRELVERMASSKRALTTVLQIDGVKPGSRYFAIARRVNSGPQRFGLHDPVLEAGSLVMIVVHSDSDVFNLHSDLYWRTFSFTQSEAQLADALLAGATLAEYAKERQVSKQTLRNQLVGIMRKTGTRRQSELVSLLTRLSVSCA